MTDREAIAELQVYMIALSELNDDAGRVQMWLYVPQEWLHTLTPNDYIRASQAEVVVRKMIMILEGMI